jgi:hypothetical protein
MPRLWYQTSRTPLASATAPSSCILARTYGSSTWTRRVSTAARGTAAPPASRRAASTAWRVISSCALAVSASASSANSVDSALASSPRMRRSARASSGADAVSARGTPGPQRDGGGTSWSIRASVRSVVARTSTSRHASPAGRPSARCQAATTAGAPAVSAPSSRSWSIHVPSAREAASLTRASSAISATTSRAARVVVRRRTVCATSAGCQPRSHASASAESRARVAPPEASSPGSRAARTAAIPSASSPSGCQSPPSSSSRSQASSAVGVAMPAMVSRGPDTAREELWTAGRRPQMCAPGSGAPRG